MTAALGGLTALALTIPLIVVFVHNLLVVRGASTPPLDAVRVGQQDSPELWALVLEVSALTAARPPKSRSASEPGCSACSW